MKSSILVQPVLSEKSYSKANAENKYSFLVNKDANKIEIKKEIEREFKVTVEEVNTVTRPGKMKRDWVRFKKHRNVDMKKAVVTLKKGDKIEEFLSI